MVDISQISQQELLNDRATSVADIKVCELALLHGIKVYGKGESVVDRLTGNQQIIDAIDKEIERRHQIILGQSGCNVTKCAAYCLCSFRW